MPNVSAEDLGRALLRLATDQTELDRGLDEARRKSKGFVAETSATLLAAGRSMTNTGRTMSTNVTVPVLAAGAAIFKVGSDFETTFNQIVGLAGVSREKIGGIKAEILEMGEAIGRDPQELAEAFYFVASAGFEAEEAMEVLRISAKAAAAGLGETQTVAKVLGGVINAYGKENITAARAADILVAAVRDGTAEAHEFAGVIGDVVPTAAQLGVGFDQVSAALAGMTLTGISADEAATSLNQVLLSLLKPTTEAEAALAGMGTSSEALRKELKEKGLLSVLRNLEERFAGNDQAASQVFGNVRALRGALSLLGLDADQLNGIFADTEGALGEVDGAYKDTEGSARELDRAIAGAKRVLIELSVDVLPVVVELLKGAAGAVKAFAGFWKGLPEPVRGAIVQLLVVAAVIGPMLLVVGKLTSGLGMLFGIFRTGGPLIRGASAALSLFSRAAGAAGVASALQTGYLKALYAGDWIRKAWGSNRIVQGISSGLSSALGAVGRNPAVSGAMSKLGSFMGSGLGKAFGIGFAAIAIFEVFATYDRLKKEHEAQLADIDTNVGNQLATGTTASLQQSKAALEKGLQEINGVWDAGIFTTDSRRSLEEQLAAVDAELARRAAQLPSTVAGAIAGGMHEVTTATNNMWTLPKPDTAAAAAAGNEVGQAAAQGVATGISELKQLAVDAWDRLLDLIKNATTPAAEASRLTGRLLSDRLANALNDGRPEVRAQAELTKQTMLDRLTELGAGGASLSKKAAAQIEAGLKSKNPQVRANANAARTSYLKGLEQYVSNGGRLSKAAARQVELGLKSKNAQVKAAAERIRDLAKRPLQQLAGQTRTYGANTAQAYADGIRSKINAIQWAAKLAVSGARKILEAGSPPGPESPLHLVDVWGERTMQAYAGGLARMGGAVRGAVRGVVGGAAEEFGRKRRFSAGAVFGRAPELARVGEAASSIAHTLGDARETARGGDSTVINLTTQGLPMRAETPAEVVRRLRRASRLGTIVPPPPRPAWEPA